MSKLWFASFKRAAACAAVSAILALALDASSGSAWAVSGSRQAAKAEGAAPLSVVLPERLLTLSTRGGQVLRVGDTVAYSLEGWTDPSAESQWAIDPKQGGLKNGFLFRAGKLFTPLAPGELSLPSLPILDEKGVVVAKTKPIQITIVSNISEKERNSGQPPKPEPAIGPMGLRFPVWIQSAIAFSLLLLVLMGVYFLVRYLRNKAAAALKKILPKKPYDAASLERLDGLLKQGLLEKGAFKPFYFGISEVLKFYLGERFEFEAQESTTSELVLLLTERIGTPGLNETVVRRVQKLFDSLDPVKFADQIPSLFEAKEVHREAREIISVTRKVAAEPILKEAK